MRAAQCGLRVGGRDTTPHTHGLHIRATQSVQQQQLSTALAVFSRNIRFDEPVSRKKTLPRRQSNISSLASYATGCDVLRRRLRSCRRNLRWRFSARHICRVVLHFTSVSVSTELVITLSLGSFVSLRFPFHMRSSSRSMRHRTTILQRTSRLPVKYIHISVLPCGTAHCV